MCELLGICARDAFRTNDLLDAFFEHSNEHKHGWGLAVFRKGGVSLEKEPVQAGESTYLKRRMSRPVTAANLFAHIRFATIGRIEYANCHPFVWDDDTGRTWTLIHNGTLFEAEPLAPFLDQQEGTTDSERLLMYIVSRVNGLLADGRYAGAGSKSELSAAARFLLLDEIIRQMSAGNKLNMLLFDGEYMYVHTNCRNSLFTYYEPCKTIFATRPIRYDGWEPLPMNQLFVYRDGEPVFTGQRHNHEFIEEEHDMSSLMSAYAEL